jgi:hypothetical protein
MRRYALIAIIASVLTFATTPSRAARFVWLGEGFLYLGGRIAPGDDATFTAIAGKLRPLRRGNYTMLLNSPGGYVPAAIGIGRLIHEKGFATVIEIGGQCNSACPLIWLSGRWSFIQRNSIMAFHRSTDAETDQMMVDYYHELGMTEQQIGYFMASPNNAAHLATEAEARRLGFYVQKVTPTTMDQCETHYCLIVPSLW